MPEIIWCQLADVWGVFDVCPHIQLQGQCLKEDTGSEYIVTSELTCRVCDRVFKLQILV